MKFSSVTPFVFMLLSGCAASIGGSGPAGPPGTPGPPGPTNAAPQRLALLRTAVDLSAPADVDVIVTEGANVTVSLPSAAEAGRGRTITVRALAGKARLLATGSDRVDAAAALQIDKDEMATVISDGDSRWIVIASSDL